MVVSVQVLRDEVVYGMVEVSVQRLKDEVMMMYGTVLQTTLEDWMVYELVDVSMTSVTVVVVTGTRVGLCQLCVIRSIVDGQILRTCLISVVSGDHICRDHLRLIHRPRER